jgi:hypothetical protein
MLEKMSALNGMHVFAYVCVHDMDMYLQYITAINVFGTKLSSVPVSTY